MAPSQNNPSSEKDNHVDIPDVDVASYSSTTNVGVPQGMLFSASHTEISSSPLPSPEILRGYSEIIPDSAERFMKMVEMEQENRFENDRVERERVKGELDLKRKGQYIAFFLVLVFLIVGIVLAIIGQNVISYVMFGMTMIPVVGLFYRHK